MTDHYAEAERLIDDAESCEAGVDGWPIYFQEAQIHATLALVDAVMDLNRRMHSE